MTLSEQLKETVGALRATVQSEPEIGVILGTGLGGFGRKIRGAREIPYSQIPHFPRATVESHKGQLVFGRVAEKEVVVMEGRFHVYEGYTAAQVAYPVRAMRALGARTLLISNAAGGMNPDYEAGDLMLISDHINLMGVNPLIGPNDDAVGLRFPDMSAPYDEELMRLAELVARECDIPLRRGVYVAVVGPNLETKAEYRFLRGIGADAVGMSTVPEVLAAVHGGMRVLGVSCITDMCIPEILKPAVLEEILEIARAAEPKVTRLISGLIEKIGLDKSAAR
ncbi:MAG: purine-nucleoside phosphorylase [Candidatus Omnitrophica bacterium]|nr:purine-nucleoside phosphorylase [Candidatus Omnitrophota bacterium]